jgi:folate-binding protein YgfZ
MPDQSARLLAARGGAAAGPVLARGLLRLTGKDRLKFLHRVSTQKVDGLPPGAAVHAAFLGVKGHVIADAIVVLRADEALVDLEPAALEPLRTHLVRYVVMDQVKVEDVSAAFRVVPAFGPAGRDLARERAPTDAVAWENARRGAPALDVLLPPAEADAFHDGLVAAGATPLSADDLEALRVLAGVARFGADLDGTRLPMEAALVASAVSFEKGCYLGQEVVARGTFRGQIQKGLVQVALPPGTAAGAPLTAGGKEVGVVTSAVETPEGRVGLAYLRRAHWNEGERLALPAGEAVVRRVLVLERE